MEKRFVALIVSLVFSLGISWAQSSVDNFSPLQSEGPIPSRLSDMMGKADDKESFVLSALKEGRVLYGTSLNAYVQQVADNLLEAYPQLKSELQFYILKSPVVNAYSTEQGCIFVNVGLLAQLSNEAELAFILAHEIAHYTEHHSDLLGEYKNKYQGADFIQYYLNYHSRSREQEADADKVAIERYFGHSSYSYSVMDGVFDVLQYSELPFDELPFDHNLVETSFYQFPANYFLPNVAPIADRSEIIDTLSTHPNLEKRRTAVKLQVTGLSDAGRSVFLQPESSFKAMRDLARLECIHQWLVSHQYDKVIYNCHVLKHSMPDNKFVDKSMVTAFYGLSKHKNYGQVSHALTPYKEVEGEMQQVSYFLSKLSRQESSLLALRFAWNAHREFPEDAFYMDLIKDEMKDVFVKNKMKYTDFSDYPMGFDLGSLEPQPNTSGNSKSEGNKYDRIKHNNQQEMVRPTEKFKTGNYMLVDIHRDSLFVSLMNSVVQSAENEQILNAIATPKAADMSKLLIVRPLCGVEADRNDLKSLQKAIRKSDKQEDRLTLNLVRSAKKLKLKPLFFDTKQMAQFDTRQYNDYATIQQWYREYKQAGGIEMQYQQSDELARIAKELDCNRMCLVVTNSSKYNFFSYYKLQSLIFSIACPYIFPFALAQLAMPRYSTNVDVVITDFTTGKQVLHSSNTYYSPMRESYLNAEVYNELYKFVKGKK
ncbi:MAG: M48 family metallopeptidase [Bacteroidales bacterium]|nr:M48 family metallopeptidase [Bacteroidales bacterium]